MLSKFYEKNLSKLYLLLNFNCCNFNPSVCKIDIWNLFEEISHKINKISAATVYKKVNNGPYGHGSARWYGSGAPFILNLEVWLTRRDVVPTEFQSFGTRIWNEKEFVYKLSSTYLRKQLNMRYTIDFIKNLICINLFIL